MKRGRMSLTLYVVRRRVWDEEGFVGVVGGRCGTP